MKKLKLVQEASKSKCMGGYFIRARRDWGAEQKHYYSHQDSHKSRSLYKSNTAPYTNNNLWGEYESAGSESTVLTAKLYNSE